MNRANMLRLAIAIVAHVAAIVLLDMTGYLVFSGALTLGVAVSPRWSDDKRCRPAPDYTTARAARRARPATTSASTP